MSKFLKFFLIGLLSLALLIVVLIGGVFLFVDPNDYKGEITAAVQDATGRELTISGDIKLSIYPWLGLSLGATQLSNARGFGDAPFASVDAVEIKVKLLPLLQKRVEMQKVRLHDLRASLAKNKEGRSNWDDLVTPATTTSDKQTVPETLTTPTAPETTKPAQAIGILGALAIDGLELENAHLEWDDQQANQHIVIDKLTLRTGPLAMPAPIDLTLSLDVAMNNPELNGHVDFSGQVSLDLDAQKYRAEQLDLVVKAKGAGLPISPVDARLRANVIADLANQQIDVSNLQLNTLGTNIVGQIKVTHLNSAPNASGQITIANFSPRELVKTLGLALPETSDTSVLTKAKMDLEFNASLNEANLKKLSVVLDDTELSGTASVNNFSNPAIRFNLMANGIDVDRYLPPSADTSPTPPTPGSAAAAATQLPLEPLRALDVVGNVELGKLKIVDAHLSNIKLGMNGKGGLLQLQPIQASLYQGNYKGDIELDVRKDMPKVSMNESLTDVNVGPLLKDVIDKELVSGTANVTAQLTTTGTDLDTIKKTLNGKASFSFRDGKVNGVNIGQMIREAYAKLNKKPAPPKTENETDFAEMSGTVTITNGLVSNEDLSAKSPLLRINGKGNVNLPTERIKYLVNTAIVESNEGQAGKELTELKSLTIPIKVTGTISKPDFGLDLGPVLQARVKKEIEKEKKKINEKVDSKVKEEKEKLRKKLEEDLKKKLGIKF